MADETRQIQVILGPYRDHRLTVSSADADAAINNHWAVDPFAAPAAPDEEPHPPLTDEERTAALEAATTWAQAQWDAAQGIHEPKAKPGERPAERDMKPEDRPGGYSTRQIDHPAPSPEVPHSPRRGR